MIRTLGDSGTVESLANTTIALPSGRFVKLSDLGLVIDSYEELKSFARIDARRRSPSLSSARKAPPKSAWLKRPTPWSMTCAPPIRT